MTIIIEENRECKSTSDGILDIIDDQSRAIQLLQSQLEEERNLRIHLESSVNKHIDSEKDRIRMKSNQLSHEVEELRKIIKQKDVALFALEEESNQQIRSLKDSFSSEKKKILVQCEAKLRQETVLKNDGEIIQLRNLVMRQNKAIKLQS